MGGVSSLCLGVFQLEDARIFCSGSKATNCQFALHCVRFVESSLERESVCVFSACITRSRRSCISWPVFFPGGCKGPLWVVWHEAWPAVDLHKRLMSGQGIVRGRVRL